MPDPDGAQPGQALRSGHRHGPCRLRPLSRRGAGGDRRQRRRQVDPDQGAVRRGRAGQRRDPARGAAGAFHRPDGRPRRRHRDGLPDPGAVARPVDRGQPVPRPRDLQGRLPRQVPPDARPQQDACDGAPAPDRPRPDDHPEHRPAGRDPLGRSAPGRRGGARRRLRQQGHHHGRADRGARRQGIAPRARADPRRQERAACRSC